VAIQKQNVPIQFREGADTKTNSQLVVPSRLVVADNVLFGDADTIVESGGPLALSNTVVVGESITRIGVLNGSGVVETDAGLYALSPSQSVVNAMNKVVNARVPDGVIQNPRFTRVSAELNRVASIREKGTEAGSGVPQFSGSYDAGVLEENGEQYTCYAWETRDQFATGRQGIQVHITRTNSEGTFVVRDFLIPLATGEIHVRPRVLARASGLNFYIYYARFQSGGISGSLSGVQLVPFTGAQVGGQFTLTGITIGATAESLPGAEFLFDLYGDTGSDCAALCYRNAPGGVNQIVLCQLGGSWNSILFSSPFTTTQQVQSISVTIAFNGVIYGLLTDNSTTVFLTTRALNTAAGVVAPFAFSTVPAGYLPERTTIAQYDSDDTVFVVDSVQTGGVHRKTNITVFSSDFLNISTATWIDEWAIHGRAVSLNIAGSIVVVPMEFRGGRSASSTVRWTDGGGNAGVFLCDLKGAIDICLTNANAVGAPHVLARLDAGEVANQDVKSATRVPATPLSLTGTRVQIPYLKFEADLRLVGNRNDTGRALVCATIDWGLPLNSVEANNVLFMAGACPIIYDGVSCFEEGYHHAPYIISATAASVGTYKLPAAIDTFSCVFTLIFYDAAGNRWESPPSNQVQVSTTATNRYLTFDVVLPPTQKPGVFLALHRTRGDSIRDTTLYAASSSRLTSTFEFYTPVDDTELRAGETLYTTGGVVPNWPAPACTWVTRYQNRLVLSGCLDGRAQFSKSLDTGFSPEFTRNPAFGVLSDAEATAELDDRLYLFSRNKIQMTYGQGPDALGRGAYPAPLTLVPDIGLRRNCALSVTRTVDGVWFMSLEGLRLLNRNSEIVRAGEMYLGARVDALALGRCTGVQAGSNSVWFYLHDQAAVLVWDHNWQQFTRLTSYPNKVAATVSGVKYHSSGAISQGLSYYERTGYAAASPKIRTAWIALGGPQGFERVSRVEMLGQLPGGEAGVAIALDVAFDYGAQQPANGVADFISVSTDRVFQFRHQIAYQKCQSVQFTMEWLATLGKLRLSDFSLLLGVKPGQYRHAKEK
jgi:hypothetical protein